MACCYFWLFDKNGDNVLDKDEFIACVYHFGEKGVDFGVRKQAWTKSQVGDLFKVVDTDNDDMVSMDEFTKFMCDEFKKCKEEWKASQ